MTSSGLIEAARRCAHEDTLITRLRDEVSAVSRSRSSSVSRNGPVIIITHHPACQQLYILNCFIAFIAIFLYGAAEPMYLDVNSSQYIALQITISSENSNNPHKTIVWSYIQHLYWTVNASLTYLYSAPVAYFCDNVTLIYACIIIIIMYSRARLTIRGPHTNVRRRALFSYMQPEFSLVVLLWGAIFSPKSLRPFLVVVTLKPIHCLNV